MSKSLKALVALVAIATLAAACGGDDDDTATAPAASPAETTMAGASGPEGPACSAVPADGEGSFDGMADDPVATAASNNPALTTLVAAVSQAGLVDTLNSGGPWTVFAPTDAAFAAIPADTMDAVMADDEMLTGILTYHVVAERIEPDELGGTYETVNGAELTVSGAAPGFAVGDASVVCSGIQTDNATVYLIDAVLLPPSDS
ncbi:MAG TPA: fasciclin domain-containing protein [Acidimicrobiales bacterium]|nr:fasciclin domain-containing protein [Acidimicrobiales bacterium]